MKAAQKDDIEEKAAETGEVFKSNVAQLLGVRGGEQTTDKWKIRLQLTKPVTWVPLIWGALRCACLSCMHCASVLPFFAASCSQQHWYRETLLLEWLL